MYTVSMQFHAATDLAGISSNTFRASSSCPVAAYRPTRLVVTCPPDDARAPAASARAWRARPWGSARAPSPPAAIAARRVENENALGRSPWRPTRQEKSASRDDGAAPDAAAARRRRLAMVGDAGEEGVMERRKRDSARGRSVAAAARKRSLARRNRLRAKPLMRSCVWSWSRPRQAAEGGARAADVLREEVEALLQRAGVRDVRGQDGREKGGA
jgi:hypothetical protein